MARVPLPLGLQRCHPCLQGADPFFLLANHRQQVHDQLVDDHWRLFPVRGIKRQSFGQWEGGNHTGDPRDVQPIDPEMVHAAFIAQNPANFQQKLADEPCAVILHLYPLKAYTFFGNLIVRSVGRMPQTQLSAASL